MEIKNKNFLVTGAASGLGNATARRLIDAGARVIMSDSNEAIGACADDLGAQAIAHHGDVTRADDVRAAVELAKELGGLHGVVHCAGVA
jgi:NAD(P)-dependent dehydrogenase (short-subunit alcohol dehydrogenase family)